MPTTITDEQIRTRRHEQGLTLEQLAARSGVNLKTIHLVESGKRKRGARPETIRKLAKALGLELEQPKADRPGDEADDVRHKILNLVQMNLRVPAHVRNAWSLLALRYGIGIARLAELAPLALLLVAEGSLAHRRQRLEELRGRIHALEGMAEVFPDWPPGLISSHSDLRDAAEDEAASIEARDLFGEKWSGFEAFPEDRVLADANPFLAYLQARLSALDDAAELHELSPRGSGAYSICRSDLERLLGGDEEAMDAIAVGDVLLNEMPGALRRDGPVEARVAWVREKQAIRKEEETALWARLGVDLDLDAPGMGDA